jgi:hypothetical protein
MLAVTADWMPKVRRFKSDGCLGFIIYIYPVDTLAMENNDWLRKLRGISAPN